MSWQEDFENMTPEQKKMVLPSKTYRKPENHWWASATDEAKQKFCEMRSRVSSNQWAKTSLSELEAFREARSKETTELWAKRSPEEVMEVGESISKAKIERWALKSKEELSEFRKTKRENMQAWWDSRTPEQMVIIKEQRARTFEKVRLGMSEETKALRIEKIRVAAEKEWADRSEGERQEVVDKIRRGRSKHFKGLSDEERSQKFAGKAPNATEWFLGTLLEEEFPGEWEYVGNRKLWIGNLNPDWVHSNGSNLVIEMFGSFYHDFRYFPEKLSEEETIEYYRLQGYKCLVLWDDELSRDFVVSSVKNLMEVQADRKGWA